MTDADRIIVGFDVSVTRVGVAAVLSGDGSPLGCEARFVNFAKRGWSSRAVADFVSEQPWIFRPVLAIYVEQPAFPRVSGPESAFKAGRALQVVVSACELVWSSTVELLKDAQWKDRADVRRHKGSTIQDVYAATAPPWPAPSSAKPDVYLRALELGFRPGGSQDAADAALVAHAGWITVNRTKED